LRRAVQPNPNHVLTCDLLNQNISAQVVLGLVGRFTTEFSPRMSGDLTLSRRTCNILVVSSVKDIVKELSGVKSTNRAMDI
jgi:hypothetical protein